MLFRGAVIRFACEQLWQNPPLEKKKATRHHARGAMMQTAESLREPCSHTNHCISQMPPVATCNHNIIQFQPNHGTSPVQHEWKMDQIITSQTAAKRILIEFNYRRDWIQRSCCMWLVRCGISPEGQHKCSALSRNVQTWRGERHSQLDHWSDSIIWDDIKWIRDREKEGQNE